jgi:RNA polymerase sigma factor (sigma-70 family)
MLDQRRVAVQPDEKREQLFTERYESLLGWAMRLTNQQREAAEDLVQDAFVQFVLGRTRLEEIENIDGYLRRMLRYMYVSRLNRSAQLLHDTALSVADYDSCQIGWTAIEPPRRMQASEELHQICTYACARKESSRAGSVLILRFFHDYFPTEIAAILNSSRHCIDQWQRLARREAKLFMTEPARLRFVNATPPSSRPQIKYLKSDCDLMLELRQMIFNSRGGACLAQTELAEIYTGDRPDALTTAKLAHIVSCPVCLDAVNTLLGLPLLAQRYRTEPSEPNEPKDPPADATGGGASGGGSGVLRQKFAHRLRETHEHKPQELRIAVNGYPVSSLKVSSDLSELDLNLTPDDPVEFVEVSSEQGVQMLFFSIDPNGSQSEQWAWIELSEGRSLEALFRNDSRPGLHVIYKDPVPAENYITGDAPNAHILSSPLFAVPGAESKQTNGGTVSRLGAWFKQKLRTAFSRALVAAETTAPAENTLVDGLKLPNPARNFEQKQSSRQLGWLIVLVSVVAIAGFLFFKASLTRTLSATALLENASVAEQSKYTVPDRVRHRFINLEERRSAEGAIVAQRKIEIWENHTTGTRAQRLYDQSNRLLGATWQTADGSRTVYHHGSKPQSQPSLATPENLLLNLEDIWQLEPAAKSFATLIAQPVLAEVEERSTSYVLRYEKERTIGASQLLKATLTLSKSDLHAIEQTLLLQRGGELREYRFVEAGLELRPAKDVAPSVFEIEPELTGGAGEHGGPGDWALRDLTTSRVPPSPSTSMPPVASAELEVDVAYLLNQAKADRNEQVNLTRSAGGSLRVEGVVDSQERRDEFLRALAPVSNNPAVKIELQTVAEAMQRRLPVTTVTVQDAEASNDTVAADLELRRYFAKSNPGETEEAIRSYSSRLVNQAYATLFQAIELKRLINRFANVDMRTVAPDARAKWLAMVREHASAFERQNAVLRQEIQPVFFPEAPVGAAEEIVIENDADLSRTVERLHQLALGNNSAIRSALTISSQSSANAIRSTEFRQSIQRAGELAKAVRLYASGK